MKLVTFALGDSVEIGAVRDGGVVSFTRAAPDLATDMMELIAGWGGLSRRAEEIVASRPIDAPLEAVRLLAPIARPGKILAIGLNYADHIAESGMATPEQQIWFCKLTTSVNGPFDPIDVPRVSPFLDYEAEMVAVIGKRCRHVAAADAASVVFGYSVGNDVTVRDWQHRTPQWMLGKSFDTHAPYGPWITTADEIGDPHRLGIRCFVNGERRQNSNTDQLVFNVWDQIAHLSQAVTLEPGDLIFTGTPGGIGAAMDPRCFLRSGDKVRVEIDELGAIEAECRPEP